MEEFCVREVKKEDAALLLRFIRCLADYEKRPQDATVDVAALAKALFEEKTAHALIAEQHGIPIGYAVYYPLFSTFKGICSLYLEDLFILPEYRGQGLGKALLKAVAQQGEKRGWQDMQWSCLEWNTASIEFYRSLGAKQKQGTVGFILEGYDLACLTAE